MLDIRPTIRQNVYVRVISLKLLREFWDSHRDAEQPLRLWYKTAEKATWSSLHDVRKTYTHADPVKTKGGDRLTVFDIGGNKFRLIVRINYDHELVNVRSVLTHKEYDEGKWKE